MNDWVTSAFSLVCGQYPEHIWAPGGVTLPCCQRCTGLYAGAFCAVVVHLLTQPHLARVFVWLHLLLLLQMAPFGFHWVAQGPTLRTLSGACFSIAVVAFLWLLPAARWAHPDDRRHASVWGYGFALLVCATLPLTLALWAGRAGALSLTLMASLGATALLGLALLNLALLLGSVYKLIQERLISRPVSRR
jgi:uncharacterized membrane protein